MPESLATTAKPRRRFFQYSLRTLLLVVTLLGAVCAWQVHIVRERQVMRRELETDGWRFHGRPDIETPWLRRLIGDEVIESITRARPLDMGDGEIDKAKKTFPEAIVIEFRQ